MLCSHCKGCYEKSRNRTNLEAYAALTYNKEKPNGCTMTAIKLPAGETNSARMNFRTKPQIKATIQRAAILAGIHDSTFTINAAYQSALATIAAHERTLLAPVDHEAFFAALEQPATPTERLKEALAHYNETVTSA